MSAFPTNFYSYSSVAKRSFVPPSKDVGFKMGHGSSLHGFFAPQNNLLTDDNFPPLNCKCPSHSNVEVKKLTKNSGEKNTQGPVLGFKEKTSYPTKTYQVTQRYAEKQRSNSNTQNYNQNSYMTSQTKSHEMKTASKVSAAVDSKITLQHRESAPIRTGFKTVAEIHEFNKKSSKKRFEEQFDPEQSTTSTVGARWIRFLTRQVSRGNKNKKGKAVGKSPKEQQEITKATKEGKTNQNIEVPGTSKANSTVSHSANVVESTHHEQEATDVPSRKKIRTSPVKISSTEFQAMRSNDPIMNPGREFTVRKTQLDSMIQDPESWLDENIIDGYIRFLVEDFSDGTVDHISCQLINQTGVLPNGDKEFTIHQGLLNHVSLDGILLIPVYLDHHYFLVSAHVERGKITVYDSLSLTASRIGNHVAVAKHIGLAINLKLGEKLWTLVWSQTCPMQQNGYDCGLFVIHNAKCIITGEDSYKFGELEALSLRHHIRERFVREHSRMLKCSPQPASEPPALTNPPDVIWTTSRSGIQVSSFNIDYGSSDAFREYLDAALEKTKSVQKTIYNKGLIPKSHKPLSNKETTQSHEVFPSIPEFETNLNFTERRQRYQMFWDYKTHSPEDNIARSRKLSRTEGLIRKAVEKGLKPEQFGLLEALARHDPAKRSKIEFMKFLCHLNDSDSMMTILRTLSELNFSVNERRIIAANLSHFSCKKRMKSGLHEAHCMLNNASIFTLKEQQLRELLKVQKIETVQEQDLIETDSAEKEIPADFEAEVQRNDTCHTLSSSSSDGDQKRPVRTRRPPCKYSPSTYLKPLKPHFQNASNEVNTCDEEAIKVQQKSEDPATETHTENIHTTPLKTKSPYKQSTIEISEENVLMVRDTPTKSALTYTHPEKFEFNISFEEWSKYWDNQTKKLSGKWAQVINKYFSKIPIACAFHAKSHEYLAPKSSKGILKLRGYCQKSTDHCQCGCKSQFVLYVKTIDPNKGVQIEGSVTCEGGFKLFLTESTGRPVSGRLREDVKKVLEFKKAKKHHLETTEKTSSVQFLHKNFPTRSLQVDQKIRSEALNQQSLSAKNIETVIQNMYVQFRANPKFQYPQHPSLRGYIRRYSTVPQLVQLSCPEQIRFAKLCNVVYLDATGSMVRKLRTDEGMRQVLLHSAVGKLSMNSRTPGVPIFDILSSRGTTDEVESMITHFKHDMDLASKSTWKPKLVVVDFCLAYLHALAMTMCEESLDAYINRKWAILHEEQGIEKQTTIFVCSGHVMQAVSRNLRKKITDKFIIKIAMHAFAGLVELRNKEDMNSQMLKIISVFGNPNLPEDLVEEYVSELLVTKDEFDENDYRLNYEFTMKTDEELEDFFPQVDPKLQREKSNFYQKYKTILNRTNRLFNEPNSSGPNKYAETPVLEVFERWFTYLPLYSKLTFFAQEQCPSETITTGVVENYFHQLKHIHHLRRRVSVPIFIQEHAKAVLQSVDYALRVGSSRAPPKKKQTKTLSIATADEEKWEDVQEPSIKKRGRAKANLKDKVDSDSKEVPETVWKPKKGGKRTTYSYKIKNPTKTLEQLRKKKASTSPELKPEKKKLKTSRISNIKDTVEVLHIEESEDEFELVDRLWVNEVADLSLFRTHFQNETGTEQDLLTLAPNQLVNCRVASALAQEIVYQFVDGYDRQNIVRAIDSGFIEALVVGETLQLKCNSRVLPSPTTIDTTQAKLVLISFLRQHAWLTVVDFKTHQIDAYDSLPGIISEEDFEEYYDYFVAALSSKYHIDGWMWRFQECSRQKGNDCVVMALMCLESILEDKDRTVDPNSCVRKRRDYIKILLQNFEKGQKLLINNNNDISAIMEKLLWRQKERKKQEKLLNMKTTIRKLEEKYHKSPTDAQSSSISKKKLELRAKIDQYEDSYYKNPFPGPVEFFL